MTSSLSAPVQAAANTNALTINPATLTASLTGIVLKIYDGGTAATPVAANFNLAGVIPGDSVTVNIAAGSQYNNKNVGLGKTVSVTGLALAGPDQGNYVLASPNISGAVGEIDDRLKLDFRVDDGPGPVRVSTSTV